MTLLIPLLFNVINSWYLSSFILLYIHSCILFVVMHIWQLLRSIEVHRSWWMVLCMKALYECKEKEIWEYHVHTSRNILNGLQLTDINEGRGVNHKICHDILMNSSMYALESIPTGFQIYA